MIGKTFALLSTTVFLTWASVAAAEVPTELSCELTYKACDAKCNLEDPEHGFSYAKCSAVCVADKAACTSKIIYDKSSTWTKKQYEAAKPWVKEKAQQAGEMAEDVKENVNEAIKDSKQEYPQ